MAQKVLVTGASGFIGSNLVRFLKQKGYYVTAYGRSGTNEFADHSIRADILDTPPLQEAMREHQIVFHCAALISFNRRKLQESIDINVTGTRNICQTALDCGVGRVVYLSACAVLGWSECAEHIRNENSETHIAPHNTYAYTKLLAEEVVQEHVRAGLNASIANISTVYGPGDLKFNSASVLRSVLRGGIKLVPPGGTSYVGMDDLVNGLLLIGIRGLPGERYILSAGNITYKDLFSDVATALELKVRIAVVPKFLKPAAVLAAKLGEPVFDKVKRGVNLITPQIIEEAFGYKYFDNSKACRELGWRCSTTLIQSVCQSYDYLHERGLL